MDIVAYLKEKKDASSCRRRGNSEREAFGDSDEEGELIPLVERPEGQLDRAQAES